MKNNRSIIKDRIADNARVCINKHWTELDKVTNSQPLDDARGDILWKVSDSVTIADDILWNIKQVEHLF